MKKLVLLLLLLCCASFLYAQTSMTLDDAILDSVDFFSSKVPSGSTIAVINFEAETQDLSDFIVQELLVGFANTGNVRVVERSRLEMLESELNFNMSGSVSDETAQGIGRMTGAQILFSGSIVEYRDMYRIRVQAIAVETAEIIGIRTINIRYDPTLTGLLGRINPADQWKYQWLYVGISMGYCMKVYLPSLFDESYVPSMPYGFSGYIMVQPFDLFGITFDVSGNMGYSGHNIFIEPTLIISPSSFEVDLFFGCGLNLLSPNFAFSGGTRGGVHIGPGVLFAEARITGVFRDWEDYGETYTDLEVTANFSLGYKIGFIRRKK
jgi:TolB-like protein